MATFPDAKQIGGLAALALLALLTACAPSPAQRDRALHRAVNALARSKNPDALAAAGILAPISDRVPAARDYVGMQRLLTQAVDLAPDRPDLVWLQIQACDRISSCDPRPLEARLRALDPANGVVEFWELRRVFEAHDDTAVDAALVALEHSDRVDIYWTTLSSRLGTALAGTHDLSLSEAVTAVNGTLAALPIRAYPIASQACKGDRLQRPEVVAACRGVARSFERGDSVLTEALGAAIALRVWPVGSPEWTAAARLRRVLHYQAQMELKNPWPLPSESSMRQFIELLIQYRREQDVFAAALSAQGLPPDPPDTWIDPHP